MKFREFIGSQFHSNIYLQQHTNLQPNAQFKYSQRQEIQPQRHLTYLNNKEVEKSSLVFGAGEAMCSTTELTVGNGNNKANNFLKQSFNGKNDLNELNSVKKIFAEVFLINLILNWVN